MTELETRLLAAVEQLEKESRERERLSNEREKKLIASMTALREQFETLAKRYTTTEARMKELISQYNTVVKYLENSR